MCSTHPGLSHETGHTIERRPPLPNAYWSCELAAQPATQCRTAHTRRTRRLRGGLRLRGSTLASHGIGVHDVRVKTAEAQIAAFLGRLRGRITSESVVITRKAAREAVEELGIGQTEIIDALAELQAADFDHRVLSITVPGDVLWVFRRSTATSFSGFGWLRDKARAS